MIPTDHQRPPNSPVRETYQEYTVEGTRVSTIADPENAAAWIQSDQTLPIEP